MKKKVKNTVPNAYQSDYCVEGDYAYCQSAMHHFRTESHAKKRMVGAIIGYRLRFCSLACMYYVKLLNKNYEQTITS